MELETGAVGDRDGLRASVDTQLGQDVLDVCTERARRDPQLVRDLLRAPAGGQQRQDLALPCRQGVEVGVGKPFRAVDFHPVPAPAQRSTGGKLTASTVRSRDVGRFNFHRSAVKT